MKNHKDSVAEKSITNNPLDFEKRKAAKLVAALTLLGMGLGVNLEEAQAGMEKVLATKDRVEISQPSVDYIKIETPNPSVEYGKIHTSKPSVAQDKSGPKKPSANYWKMPAPNRPGVTRAKPVPATTGQLPGKIDAKKIITPSK